MNARRRSTRLTRRGTAMIAAGSFLLAAGSYLRVGEMLALGAAGVALPPIGFLRVIREARRASLEVDVSHSPSRPVRGRPVTIRTTLRNVGRHALDARIAADAVFVAEPPAGSVRLARGASELLATTSDAIRRGRHRIGPVRVTVGDGAGLAACTWTEPVRGETLVLPAFTPVEGAPTLPPEERTAGNARRSPLRGTEFHTLREYQRGDDLRQVHWRASARHGSLLVRELEPLAMPRFTILIDDRARPGRDSSAFELAVSCAASVCAGLVQRGSGVRLVTSAARVDDHGYGRTALDRLVERLAVLEPAANASLADAVRRSTPHGRGGGLVFIGSGPVDDATLDALRVAGRRHGFAGAMLCANGTDAAAVDQAATLLRADGWSVVVLPATGGHAHDRDLPREAWRRLVTRAPQ